MKYDTPLTRLALEWNYILKLKQHTIHETRGPKHVSLHKEVNDDNHSNRVVHLNLIDYRFVNVRYNFSWNHQ